MINYVKFNTKRERWGDEVIILNVHQPGMVQVISSSGATLGVSLGHISSMSLEGGLLTQADRQGAVGAAPVCFSVPPVDGICGHDDTTGDLHRVFVVAAGAAGCGGVAGAAGTAGGLAAGNEGRASAVAGATTGVVNVSCLTASG